MKLTHQVALLLGVEKLKLFTRKQYELHVPSRVRSAVSDVVSRVREHTGLIFLALRLFLIYVDKSELNDDFAEKAAR